MNFCETCETCAHCLRHGCIPITPVETSKEWTGIDSGLIPLPAGSTEAFAEMDAQALHGGLGL